MKCTDHTYYCLYRKKTKHSKYWYIYNKKESFLTRVGVLLGIERRLPTALPSFQLVSFLISSSLSRFLSLHREGGECHGAPIGSFVFVWLQAAYRRWDNVRFITQLAVHLPFKTLAWSPFGNGRPWRLLPSVLLFTDSFIVLSFWAQGWIVLSAYSSYFFPHLSDSASSRAKRGHVLVYIYITLIY